LAFAAAKRSTVAWEAAEMLSQDTLGSTQKHMK